MAAGDVFPITPHFTYVDELEFRTLTTEFESGKTQTRALWSVPRRRFKLQFRNETLANMDSLWDFYVARKGSYEMFWFENQNNYVGGSYMVTDEAIGTGDGSTTEFALDYYPAITTASTYTFKVAGTPVSATIANDNVNEVANVTFASPPGGSTALTGSYSYYYKVRFANDRFSREALSAVAANGNLELIEVL